MKRDDIKKEITLRIADRMEYLGISQNRLAKLTGLSQPAVNLIVSGKCLPTLPTIIKIADALIMKPSELVDFPSALKRDGHFRTRLEAEDALLKLEEIVDSRGFATVKDMCDICGLAAAPADLYRGWTDLREARVVRVGEGYAIRFPVSVEVIKNDLS